MLEALGGQPARNWPRNHIVVGGLGRRHVTSTCEYDALPHNWVLDVEQVGAETATEGT
jgi:5'-nucleotidase